MTLTIGDYVTSKSHTAPSPIWRIAKTWRVGRITYADLRLAHPQGWGPGPIMKRTLTLDRLEQANELVVLALAACEEDPFFL